MITINVTHGELSFTQWLLLQPLKEALPNTYRNTYTNTDANTDTNTDANTDINTDTNTYWALSFLARGFSLSLT